MPANRPRYTMAAGLLVMLLLVGFVVPVVSAEELIAHDIYTEDEYFTVITYTNGGDGYFHELD